MRYWRHFCKQQPEKNPTQNHENFVPQIVINMPEIRSIEARTSPKLHGTRFFKFPCRAATTNAAPKRLRYLTSMRQPYGTSQRGGQP